MSALATFALVAALAGPPQDPVALPDDPARAHALAVEAYRAGDLDTAGTLWLRVRELDPEGRAVDPADAAYNLGNVAFRRGAPIEAAAWYRTTLARRPRDADAWANLEFALAEAGLPPADRGDLRATLDRLLHALDARERAGLAVLGAGLLTLALGWEALRGGAAARRAAWAAVAVAALCATPWLAGLGGDHAVLAHVVAANGATVHSEPSRGAAKLERLEPGARVPRVDELPGWVRVELDGGVRGWVPADGVLVP